MHALITTTVSGIVVALTTAGFGSSVTFTAILFAIGVALVGVPHGALDPIFGKRMMANDVRPWWLTFFASYFLVASTVFASWFVAPVLTCLTFFALASWHFGLEEDYAGKADSAFTRNVFAIARGSLVIVGIGIFRDQEMARLLAQIFPNNSLVQGEFVVFAVRASSVVLIPIALIDLGMWAVSDPHRRSTVILRIVFLSILCATVHPLVSFGIYFCCWHSVRGLRELRRELGLPIFRFVTHLVPLTATTLLFSAIAFAGWYRFAEATPALIRTVFVILSSIAIPHLFLHGLYRFRFPSSHIEGALV